MSNEGAFVELSVEDKIGRVVIHREKSLNALNEDVLQELSNILAGLSQPNLYEKCRALTIAGAGNKAFVVGADIKLMQEASPADIRRFISLGQFVMRQIENFPMPVIAVVDGFAIGGGLELALACDLIIASEKAQLGQAEVNLGLIPGFGGTQRLVHRVGTGLARRLILSGQNILAEEALERGLIDYLYQSDELQEKLADLCQNLASKGPLALAAAKRCIQAANGTNLLSGLTEEMEEFLDVFSSNDAEEGLTAFVEKRKPNFQGN